MRPWPLASEAKREHHLPPGRARPGPARLHRSSPVFTGFSEPRQGVKRRNRLNRFPLEKSGGRGVVTEVTGEAIFVFRCFIK